MQADRFGLDFVGAEFLEEGQSEYWLRDIQVGARIRPWRNLKSSEIEILVKNDNTCPDWDLVLVSDPFDPRLVKNSSFFGLVRLGALENVILAHHDFHIPVGIRNSTLIACDIGDDCAIQDCAYISHYIVGNNVILADNAEIQTTNHAKFGNGVIKQGEDESVRVTIDVMNEAGGRAILPFDGMICADAYLWAAYRDDASLMEALRSMTQRQFGDKRGAYGVIGSHSVIKSVRVIKDVAFGECSYAKGANKLKNLTVNSSEEAPTQIGEGVELVNGIIGYGCRIFYGCKAVRFVMGTNSNLKYGARLIHSVLGDNSTVSCCEILNNLIFPAHEQHHNNSFLIASLVGGQSNVAAGATIGSNHNSRAPDGELRAGRGFWPGLCVTLKHSSRFASFVLVAKGDYPRELDIPLPFSLVNNNVSADVLEIMPAYFWMHNLYALERNSWKVTARDRRVVKVQTIEADYLAPDTAAEMLRALSLLERWTAASWLAAQGEPGAAPTLGRSDLELRDLGRRLLLDAKDRLGDLEIRAEGVERGNRPSVVLKPRKAYRAYRHMLRYYSVRRLLDELESRGNEDAQDLIQSLQAETEGNGWVNLGGQIVSARCLDELRERIVAGELADWNAVHQGYQDLAGSYCHLAAMDALSVLRSLGEEQEDASTRMGPVDAARLLREFERAQETRVWMEKQIRETRRKDYENPFRTMTYRNKEEMEAVLGKETDNDFVRRAHEDSTLFRARVAAVAARLRV